MDGAVSMSATGGTNPYSFSFTNGEQVVNGPMHTGMPAGTYSLFVDDNNGCHDETNILILEPAELTASYFTQNPSCIGNRDGFIEISVMGGTEPYLFGWNDYVIDIPIISGLTQGNYEVQIIDSNNCVYSFNTITLTDMDVDCIKIPNAFTPNGDGPNDTWIIENIELFSGAYMYVYNRWGQELWVGRPGDEWDGQYNGKFVPAGTYLYIINLYDGSKPYTGTVTVIY
jgi:gliding motility-associated-like protein